MPDIRPHVEDGRAQRRGPAGHIALAAERLPDFDDPDFGRLFDRFGDARVVLLGAGSPGASEFCRARAAITRWLIENRGYNIVALDTDWPDAQVLDAFVRQGRVPAGAGRAFTGFPTWQWRNREFDAFLSWLEAHNGDRPPGAKAAVYGLDLYNLGRGMRAVVDHLERADPEAAKVAREHYGCLSPWSRDPAGDERMALFGRYLACEGVTTALLTDMLRHQLGEALEEDFLIDAAHNTRLVREAEGYYRAMYFGGGEAWDRRATHTFETLKALLDRRSDAKAVVWANTAQVGDARATEMGLGREELSLGQLCREAWGESARLIGFGSNGGTIACASQWDGPLEIKPVRPGLAESQESQCHNAGIDRFLLDLRQRIHSEVRRSLADPRLERFIGVTYRPENERWDHYAECRLPEQFDAWVWIDETTPVAPLAANGKDEAWPFRR